jgi:hypothetical protein
MIGDPFNASVPITTLTFAVGSTTYAWGEASTTGKVVSPTLYTYPSGAITYMEVGAGGTLDPYAGYWIYAAQACTLGVPPPTSSN